MELLRVRRTARKLGYWGDDPDWDIGVLTSSLACSGHCTVNRTVLPHVPVIVHHVQNLQGQSMSHRMKLGTRTNLFLLINDLRYFISPQQWKAN